MSHFFTGTLSLACMYSFNYCLIFFHITWSGMMISNKCTGLITLLGLCEWSVMMQKKPPESLLLFKHKKDRCVRWPIIVRLQVQSLMLPQLYMAGSPETFSTACVLSLPSPFFPFPTSAQVQEHREWPE